MTTENIIIGGGLSGTILAWQFYLNDKDFLLIDDNPINSSSKVAAGLYNPIVFKRLTLSWKSDKLVPYLNDFYQKIEKILQCSLHFKRKILRIIPSKEDLKLWQTRSKLEGLNEYLDPEIFDNPYPNFINAPFGVGVVKSAGNLNTNLFLELSHQYFKSKNKYINNKIEINDTSISKLINQTDSKRVIFSEGWLNTKNQYFDWVPYKLVKGEIFKIKIKGFETADVPNKRVFLLPLGNDEFIAGSTYRWHFEDDKPTEEEGNYLKDHLDKILIQKYDILDHKAGIRPAVLDRRPVVGPHPTLKNYFIFNGMGSKSVMLAPFLSYQLVEHIYSKLEINSEVDLDRYLSYFTRQKNLSSS